MSDTRMQGAHAKAAHALTELIPVRGNQDDLVGELAHGASMEPVFLYEGQVIEGRVRQAAHFEFGQQPQYKDWVLLNVKGHPLEWMVRRHVEQHELTDLEVIQLAASVLPTFREIEGQTERMMYEALGRRLSWNKIRALNWLDEAGALEPVLSGEKDIFEAARALGLAPDKRGVALGTSYGQGDKFDEAVQPLKRYLAAWKRKGYEFRHVNPKEASRRLLLIESLIEELQATIPDLKNRAVEARLSMPPERKPRQ